jgi:beta-mannanase
MGDGPLIFVIKEDLMRYRITTVSLLAMVLVTVLQISLVSATSIVKWEADYNIWSQVEDAEGQKQNTVEQVLQTSSATVQSATPNASEDAKKKHSIFLPLLSRGNTSHPANPNASEDTRKVLSYIASLPDRPENRVISGQHVPNAWDYPTEYDKYLTSVRNETGEWIALVSGDYAWGIWDDPGQNSTLIEHWNNGGLVTVSCHWYNPWTGNGLQWTGGTYTDRNIGDLSDLWTPGNAAYDMWHADMDRKAVWFGELEDAGVVVLFRLFHEMNSHGFAWWSYRDRAKFITLWRYVFDYFTYTKGLNNLLWVYAPNAEHDWTEDAEYYYPGDSYVDIVGLDEYPWDGSLSRLPDQGYPELVALGKPFAITEFGPYGGAEQPSPDSYEYDDLIAHIKTYVPQTVYFLSWFGGWAIVNQRNARELLDDPWVITRDELDWRAGPTPTPSPTPTPTSTPTPTPTQTLLPTYTPTATNTPLPTYTPTPTFTSIPSPTNTPTSLPTNTPTFAPTNTPVPTNTPLPTNTPTLTPTSTPTPTPTADSVANLYANSDQQAAATL